MLENGEFLRKDIYSVLPTKELIYPSWGAGIIYAFLYKMGGVFSINLFHKFIFMIFVYLTGKELFRKGELRLRDLIIFGVLFYNSFFFLNRPAQLAIIPFFLFLKFNLNPYFSIKKKLILSSILTVFWVNIHGSALIAPALFYVLNSSKIEGKLLLWSLLPAGLLLLNPFGWEIFSFVFDSFLVSRERMVNEWEAVASKSFPLQAFVFFTSIGLIFNRYSIGGRKPPLWVFFLLMLGVTGIRQTVWVSYALAFWFKSSGPENRKFALGNPVVLLTLNFLAIYTLFPSGQKYLGENTLLTLNPKSPQILVDKIIETKNSGPIFNDLEYGSYFVLKLENKIFLDSRMTIYPNEAYSEYQKVVEAKEGWEEVLEKYQIQFVALPLNRNRIRASLAASSQWEIYFADKDYFLARRM